MQQIDRDLKTNVISVHVLFNVMHINSYKVKITF